jgi:hypothetical protein
MVKRAFELKIPLRFFFWNDNEDFERFLDFMTKKVMGHTFEWHGCEPQTAEYGTYGTDLNEFFDMPEDAKGYKSDEPDMFLIVFKVYVNNEGLNQYDDEE